MPTEYYDRGLSDKELHPAPQSQQHLFDVARRQFTSALSGHMEEIVKNHLDVRIAFLTMTTLLKRNPSLEFKLFRPEDASITLDADSNAAFLR